MKITVNSIIVGISRIRNFAFKKLTISAGLEASEVPDLLHFPISCCGIIALALSLDSLTILVLVKVLAKKCFISPAEIYGALSFTT